MSLILGCSSSDPGETSLGIGGTNATASVGGASSGGKGQGGSVAFTGGTNSLNGGSGQLGGTTATSNGGAGLTPTGGSTSIASGGTLSIGGTTASGGTTISGGTNANGIGGSSSGGSSGKASGGTSGAGGVGGTSSGGTGTGGGVVAGASSVAARCLGNGAPVIPASTGTLIDFDMSGRAASEVLEPGYNEWVVAEATTDTKTFNGITFKLANSGGTALSNIWFKTGVQAPNYARLVCDGVSVAGGGSIQLTITGLSAGTHTLLAYHNALEGTALVPMNVDVDGTRQVTNLQTSNRALSTDATATSFVTLTATAGKAVTILYSPSSTGSDTKNVVLNGLALDVPNSAAQAKVPTPADHDWHVDADSGSVTLSWAAAKGATAHNLYFGTDAEAVSNATTSSSQFTGKQSTTSYKVSGLGSLPFYYWRVDEIDANGVVTKGAIWSFAARHIAFPGAEGYGRLARGGRCGKVVHVTNLNDSGAGSLREAVTNDIGPRTIVFDVAGTIVLASRLVMASSFVTIAGHTAPGKGVLIRNAPFGFSGAYDSVMRHIRIRVGFNQGDTYDGTGMAGSEHSIFDHISVGWSEDEGFSSRTAKNITLQRALISETLNNANHTNAAGEVAPAHGYAATISGNIGSFHHILSAHNLGRNFSMGSAIDGSSVYASRLDLFNNVIYNFITRANDGQAHEVNFVNNYFKKTAATKIDFMFSMDFENFGTGTLQAYLSGNILQRPDGTFTCDGTNNTCGRRYTLNNDNPEPTYNVFPTSGPFFPSYATIQPAKDAYKNVLSDVGANMPVFDDHDQRMIKETLAGSYTYKGSITGLPGIIDRETDVGGFESFPASSRPSGFDTDADGLPDFWEQAIGTSTTSTKGDFSNSNADLDGDGYTNLDDYLAYMSTPHAEVKTSASTTFDLASLFRGFTKSPSYKVGTNACLTASISSTTLTITPKSACGVAYLPVTVTDGDSSSMTRQVAVFATP